MYGEIIKHPKYGEQFNVTEYQLLLPEKKEELITFLSSELFPIGEKTAIKIYDELGTDAINKIIENKDILNKIPRLSQEKINKIYKILIDYEESNKIIMNITKIGFSLKEALKIYKRYNSLSLYKIENDIYDLINDIEISFKEIDDIALKNNYNINDERRIRALIIYIINSITFENGSTYMDFDEIYNNIIKYVNNIDNEKLAYELINLQNLDRIRIINEKYFLSNFYEAEINIKERLNYLNNNKSIPFKNINKNIKSLEKSNNIIYDDIQKNAIKEAVQNDLTIITGGPGTGKTTIINAIVSLLSNIYNVDKDSIVLLAPTGRATKKISESVGIQASTIHRFLGWDMDTNTFNVNENSPSYARFIIIDEVSMIDSLLFDALFKGLKKNIKLILVGDYYQLPSVGQGQILKDIIDSNKFNVIYLEKLYRQTENSYITTLAHEIKNKNLSDNCFSLKEDYNFIECSSSDIPNILIKIIEKALEKGYNDKTIQILAPMYKTKNGIDNLNKLLKDIFNSNDYNTINHGEIIYKENDKILQLNNDSNKNVYNGDIGYINEIINGKKNEMIVNFDGLKVSYSPKEFVNLTHGYAISIHKAQGSEYDMVIIPILNEYKRMLYNKLIYTGITRAKKKLIILGSKEAFLYAVNNDVIMNRKTYLKELLNNV